MNAVEKAAEVLAAHGPALLIGRSECICGAIIHDDSQYRGHVALCLADAGLLIAAFPDGHAGTLTGDLLTDMAGYAGRLRDRAEAAERALATLREDVAALVTGPTADAWHDEAARGTAVLPYASNRYVRLVDDIRAALARGTR